eukprot:6939013-Prymnesium_polylepis.2
MLCRRLSNSCSLRVSAGGVEARVGEAVAARAPLNEPEKFCVNFKVLNFGHVPGATYCGRWPMLSPEAVSGHYARPA